MTGPSQLQATVRPEKPHSLPAMKIPRHSGQPSTTVKGVTFRPVKNVPTGGISTKQRLTQAALAPVKPKSVSSIEVNPSKKVTKPLPGRSNTSNMMNLSFKKGPQPIVIPGSNQSGSSYPSAPNPRADMGTPTQSSALPPLFSQPTTPPAASVVLDTDLFSSSPMDMLPPIIDTNSPSHSTLAMPTGVLNLSDLPIGEPSSRPMLVSVFFVLFSVLIHLQCSNPVEVLTEAEKFLQEIMPER